MRREVAHGPRANGWERYEESLPASLTIKPQQVIIENNSHYLIISKWGFDMIQTIDDLQARLGPRPAVVDLKVIDHLDAHAQRWLAASPLAFAGFSDANSVHITLAGGSPGFATALDFGRLRLPRQLLDSPEQAVTGRGVGLLFLIPGLGETLRVNGTVSEAQDDSVIITVAECYAHCAKALLRSDFWRAQSARSPAGLADVVAESRFMALASADADQHTDVSPKGDPADLLVQGDAHSIRFADRPGNRRTDSLLNMLARPRAACALLVPGCTQVAIIQGATRITDDPVSRAAFAVQDKTPKLVIELANATVSLRDSAALTRAALWTSNYPVTDIDPAEVFAAHVKLHKTGGFGAAIAKRVASIPGLMRKGLEQDYKNNMY